MIKILDNKREEEAREILRVQIPSYRVEAELINFYDIPPLQDTEQSIMTSEETFIGYLVDDKLVAFLSYEEEESMVDICRMVVHPDYFRKGIARMLLQELFTRVPFGVKFTVSTGRDNLPAVHLYLQSGFKIVKDVEVTKGFYITVFEK
jgi:ribosomal protein S18 acetylase RimI-like enzyme